MIPPEKLLLLVSLRFPSFYTNHPYYTCQVIYRALTLFLVNVIIALNMNDVVEFQLKQVLKDNGEKSLYWLSKETGIAYNTLHSLSKGDKIDVRISTVQRICNALNCELDDLITISK